MKCKTTGPEKGKIAFVGEAPGEQEELTGLPFIGEAGKELTRICESAGVNRSECLITNVFDERPQFNNIDFFCISKSELPKDYRLPPISKSKYVKPELLHNLVRLKEELSRFEPNVVVALGNTALWALCQQTGIFKYRGAVIQASLGNWKVLPAFHPSFILRQYEYKAVAIVDLMKAKREADYPEIRLVEREIWLDPGIPDLFDFYNFYIKGCRILSFDIENPDGPIDCISLSPDRHHSLVIPIVDKSKPNYSYWSFEDLVRVWKFLRLIFEDRSLPKLAQNGLYDIQHRWKQFHIRVLNYRADTMIHHHAFEPDLAKNLGFLGSVFADEPAWKLLNPKISKRKREDD